MKKLLIIPLLFVCFMGMGQEKSLQDLGSAISADEKAGRVPSLSNLELFAAAAKKRNDEISYNEAAEKIIYYYKLQKFWVELFKNFRLKFGHNSRLNLDLLRLEYVTDQFTKANEFSEFAQLLLLAGCPAESLKVIERGFKAGALGTGAEAEKHKSLRSIAQKKLAEINIKPADHSLTAEKAKDGAALSNLGYGFVTAGKYEEGIKKILDVLKIEGIKFEDDAKLHLGLAYLAAGKKSDAIKTFKTVKGIDGTADLARYWLLVSNSIVK